MNNAAAGSLRAHPRGTASAPCRSSRVPSCNILAPDEVRFVVSCSIRSLIVMAITLNDEYRWSSRTRIIGQHASIDS